MNKEYCEVHKIKEQFAIPEVSLLIELANPGEKRQKVCKACMKEGKLKISISGQFKECCPIHPLEHLWGVVNEEHMEKTRDMMREALNPSLNYEQIFPKPGKGKIEK